MPEEAEGYLAAAKAKLGLNRLQSVRVHHCAQVTSMQLDILTAEMFTRLMLFDCRAAPCTASGCAGLFGCATPSRLAALAASCTVVAHATMMSCRRRTASR